MGVMAFILGEGIRDFIHDGKMVFTNFVTDYVAIHHSVDNPELSCPEMDLLLGRERASTQPF